MSEHGSKFFKTDLHFHTPASQCYKNKDVTVKNIIDEAINQNLEVIAITDHNDISGIEEAREYSKGRSIYVFPGIEITAKGGHILALFDLDFGRLSLVDFQNMTIQASIDVYLNGGLSGYLMLSGNQSGILSVDGFFDANQSPQHRQAAIDHMKSAAKHWKQLAQLASSQYKPQYLARNNYLDWQALIPRVMEDIEIVAGEQTVAR